MIGRTVYKTVEEILDITKQIRNTNILKTHFSKKYGEFDVIGKSKNNKYICIFKNTGTIVESDTKEIWNDGIKDVYAKIICGKGYIGEMTCSCDRNIYYVWTKLIKRVENKLKNYETTKICDDWYNYSIFQEDYKNLIGYKEMIKYGDSDISFHIDKDIFSTNNKIYSKDTCCIIPSDLNVFFTNLQITNKSGVVGVSWKKKNNKYVAQCKYNHTVYHLGLFDSKVDATNEYFKFKKACLNDLLERFNWVDNKIKMGAYEYLERQIKLNSNNIINSKYKDGAMI